MSVSDALHDGVTDLDGYLERAEGEAWPGHSWYEEILDVRHRMETLRCKLDGDDDLKSFREVPA